MSTALEDSHHSSSLIRIGDWKPSPVRFQSISDLMNSFEQKEFMHLTERKKFKAVNRELLALIDKHPAPCFLLPAVFHYIREINARSILKEAYSFSLFEFWLNHFSKLTAEENLYIRGKIMGKMIPRDEYQSIFPIGMNKYFSGAHFVAAHLSPDVDTTIASFSGWLDAFGARVSEGTHQWSLPKGFSDGFVKNLFDEMFVPSFLKMAPRETAACTLAALDLVTKKNFHKVSIHSRGDSIQHGSDEHAYILVDDEGCYRGEWHSHDAESARQVLSVLSNCLRWFENAMQRACIHSLAEESITLEHIESSIEESFSMIMKDSDPVKELSDRSKKLFNDYVKKVLGMSSGLLATYREFIRIADIVFNSQIEEGIRHFIQSLFKNLHDYTSPAQQRLYGLEILEKTISKLAQEINRVRDNGEKLSHLLLIKERVLGISNDFVYLKSSIEEIKNRAGHTPYLTVVVPESNGSSFPIGVIWASDLQKPILGTASLRDFSNLEETKMASYIDVISIIDHHKSAIKTSSASTLILGDAQSSNTLIAELSLAINCRWSSFKDKSDISLLQTLLKQLNPELLSQSKELIDVLLSNKEEKGAADGLKTFISRERELSEYLLFVLAILDDTDLLSKVSRRDVLCLEKLLNRMASLINSRHVCVVSFEDIPDNAQFAKNAAKRLLQNNDLYSIYKNIYRFREKEMENTLLNAAEGKPSPFFADTKEQNGCCRIGQTKLFERNMSTFHEIRKKLINRWLLESSKVYQENSHIDFFLHMISTVPGEKEVHSGADFNWDHTDEIWIWGPQSAIAEEHVSLFLSLFQNSQTGQSIPIDIVVEGIESEKREQLVRQRFPKAKSIHIETTAVENETAPVIVLKFAAGLINSRKAQISPFLPKLVS